MKLKIIGISSGVGEHTKKSLLWGRYASFLELHISLDRHIFSLHERHLRSRTDALHVAEQRLLYCIRMVAGDSFNNQCSVWVQSWKPVLQEIQKCTKRDIQQISTSWKTQNLYHCLENKSVKCLHDLINCQGNL